LCLFEVGWASVGAEVGLGSCLFAGFEQDFGFGFVLGFGFGFVLGFGVGFGCGFGTVDFGSVDFEGCLNLDFVNVSFVNFACPNYEVQDSGDRDFVDPGSLDCVNCCACSAWLEYSTCSADLD